MLKKIVKWSISNFEKKTRYNATYMKVMAESSLSLARQFSKFIKLNGYKKHTPDDIMQIAKITALKTEDCGTCLQLNIDYALKSGMARKHIINTIQSPEKLPASLKLIYDFSYKTSTNAPDLENYRSQVEKEYGIDILIELAMAIATSRVYPAIKRAMGYSTSCSVMQFNFGEGQ